MAQLAPLTGCGPPPDCVQFNSSSVSAMRVSEPSCYELAHVVVAARAPSAVTPRLFLQDARGGDNSAVMVKCSATSTHPCSSATAGKVQRLLDGASVTARGYYQRSSTGFEELYLEDIADEGVLLARPAPVALRVEDIARDKRVSSKWFQVATVDIPVADPLVMYDFSPVELKEKGPCPGWGGFAMIPSSVTTSVPVGCMAATNPISRAASDPREILIGRQFFSTFWASTDCGCWAASKQHLLVPASSVGGRVTGVLIFEQKPGAQAGYQVFEPLSRASFPISGG